MIFLGKFKRYIKVMSGGVYRYTGTDFYEKLLRCMISNKVVYNIDLTYYKRVLYQAKLDNARMKISFDKSSSHYDYMIRFLYYDSFGKKMVLSIWCRIKLNGELILHHYSINKYREIESLIIKN